MKFKSSFYVTLAFAVALCCCITPAKAIFEEAILGALEQLRVRMCYPIPQLGLPALDPLQIKNAKLSLNNKYIKDFKGSISNFRLTGLSDFVINDLSIKTVPFKRSSLDITFPFTEFKTLYTANGILAYILQLSGDGNAEASLDKVRITASWIFKNGVYLGIRSLKLTVQINGLYVDFENLIEEERINDFFLALINELGLELLNDIWILKSESVEQLVENLINKLIGTYTINDIIKLIGNGEGGPIFGDGPPGDCKDQINLITTVKGDSNTYQLVKQINELIKR